MRTACLNYLADDRCTVAPVGRQHCSIGDPNGYGADAWLFDLTVDAVVRAIVPSNDNVFSAAYGQWRDRRRLAEPTRHQLAIPEISLATGTICATADLHPCYHGMGNALLAIGLHKPPLQLSGDSWWHFDAAPPQRLVDTHTGVASRGSQLLILMAKKFFDSQRVRRLWNGTSHRCSGLPAHLGR